MPSWRRTLYAIWFTQFISMAAFSFVNPFIPYYVQELGITDTREVALWAGLAISSQGVVMALIAPLWGALADRHGRKLMLMRATYGGVVILTLMGFVANVQQLVLLRIVQGALTGTLSAATTLVAGVVPRDKAGMALGSLQTAVFLGISLGPLVGGVVGDTFGYRPSFWITGALLLVAAVLVTVFVREDFHPGARAGVTSDDGVWRLMLASGGAILAVMAARILLRTGTQVQNPVLPLFVQALVPAVFRVATLTGLIVAAGAVATAIGSPLIGSWGDRLGHRRMLIASGLVAGIFYLPQALAPAPGWLILGQIVTGFAIGGTLSTLAALLVQQTPPGREGVVFGLDSSAVNAANALGPMLGAAVVATISLHAPFLLAGGLMLVGTVVALLWVRDREGEVPGGAATLRWLRFLHRPSPPAGYPGGS